MTDHPILTELAKLLAKQNSDGELWVFEAGPETGHGPGQCPNCDDKRADYTARAKAVLRHCLTLPPSEGMVRLGDYEAETCMKDDPCGTPAKHIYGTMQAQRLKEMGLEEP